MDYKIENTGKITLHFKKWWDEPTETLSFWVSDFIPSRPPQQGLAVSPAVEEMWSLTISREKNYILDCEELSVTLSSKILMKNCSVTLFHNCSFSKSLEYQRSSKYV